MVSFLNRGSWKNTAGERRSAISSAGGGGGQGGPECRRSGLPICSLGLLMTFSRALSTQIQESHTACVACSVLAPRLPLEAQGHTLSCSHRQGSTWFRHSESLLAPWPLVTISAIPGLTTTSPGRPRPLARPRSLLQYYVVSLYLRISLILLIICLLTLLLP